MAHKQSKFRKGRAIDTIFIVLVLFGIGYGINWLIKAGGKATQDYGQAMVNTQDKSMILVCESNMRSIFQIMQVAVASDGRYPQSLSDLKSQIGDSRVFRCPDPNGSEFVYLPPKRVDDQTPTIVLYESNPVHNGKCNVLLSTGEIGQMSLEELKQYVHVPVKP